LAGFAFCLLLSIKSCIFAKERTVKLFLVYKQMKTLLKIPKEEIKELKLNHIKKILWRIDIYSLTNEYAFDNTNFISKDMAIVKKISDRIVKKIKKIGEFEIDNFDFVINFSKNEKIYQYHQLDEISQKYVDKIFEPVINEVKEKYFKYIENKYNKQ